MVCRDGAHQAAGQEETDGVQQTLDGPCTDALSGFSVCVSALKEYPHRFQFPTVITTSFPCVRNNRGVGGCQNCLCAVETAGLAREEEKTVLSKNSVRVEEGKS